MDTMESYSCLCNMMTTPKQFVAHWPPKVAVLTAPGPTVSTPEHGHHCRNM